MTRFVIAGNSHVGALLQGMSLLAEQDPALFAPTAEPGRWTVGRDSLEFVGLGSGRFELEEFSTTIAGRVRFTGQYRRSLLAKTGLRDIGPSVVWGFMNVANTARIFQQPMWKEYAPSALGRIAGRTPLTEQAVRAILRADHAPARSFYAQLAQAGARVVALEAPRPQAGHPSLLDDDDRRIARHLDALGRSMWHDWLAGHSVPRVEPPSETIGSDGFLRPELRRIGRNKYGKPDHNHGNAEFGAIYLPRILEAMTAVAGAQAAA